MWMAGKENSFWVDFCGAVEHIRRLMTGYSSEGFGNSKNVNIIFFSINPEEKKNIYRRFRHSWSGDSSGHSHSWRSSKKRDQTQHEDHLNEIFIPIWQEITRKEHLELDNVSFSDLATTSEFDFKHGKLNLDQLPFWWRWRHLIKIMTIFA